MAKILIVVDMQKDFVDGALGSAAAQAIVPAVTAKIRDFDGEIYCTMDTHGEDYLQTQEGRSLPVAHCVKGSDGWRLDAQVAEVLSGRVAGFFEKPVFGSIALAHKMAQLHQAEPIEAIHLVGLCTDICVVSNALLLKSTLPEVPIIVDAACCAGITEESHRQALAVMGMCQVNIDNRPEV